MKENKDIGKVLTYVENRWVEVDGAALERCKSANGDFLSAFDDAVSYKYEIALQCIARQEEKYFKEWIEYHLRLGIEHIFIYDNNDCDGLSDFLAGVLSEGDFERVEVIPWREPMAFQQIEALNDCVTLHRDDVKWLISLDIDEFLTLEKPMRQFLDEFSYASQVYLSWESFGADGKLYYEDKPVTERFTKTFDCRDYGQGKILFRPSRLKRWGIHGARMKRGKTVNVLHEEITPPDSYNRIFRTAWVRHYFTKSLEEWTEKIARGCSDNMYCRRYKTFFEVNPDLSEYFDPSAPTVQRHSHPVPGEIPMQ